MKTTKILLALVFVLALAGCGKKEAKPSFDFPLPDNFVLDDVQQRECSILLGNQVVGGFVATELDPDCVRDVHDQQVDAYLNTLAPPPQMLEFISMQGEGFVSINLKITDPESDVSREYKHYLFEKEGICYDLWLDRLFVEDDLATRFREIAMTAP